MGLFANMLPLETSLRILDRFVLQGDKALINEIKNVYVSNKAKILAFEEPFDLQVFLSRQIYFETIKEGKMLPTED